jgi:hypothetical protein
MATKKAVRVIAGFLIFWGIVIGVMTALYVNAKSTQSDDMVLFYSEECPNCKVVEEYIAANGIMEKLPLVRMNVAVNSTKEDLIRISLRCGVKRDEIGIPMLYYHGKCHLGKVEVVNFLKMVSR